MMRHLLPEYDTIFSGHGLEVIKAMATLRVATQNAILKLSSQMSINVDIDLGNGRRVMKLLDRKEFEDVNGKLFDQCETLIRQCLNDAKVDIEDVANVILVGGSSEIPKVRDLVRSICRREKLYEGINPMEAAVCGAALEGAVASGIGDPYGNLDLLTIQATSLSIGIQAHGSNFVPIVMRNTTVPARKDKMFTTVHDNQTEVLIVVYEGYETKIEKNHLLGFFKISGIPPLPKGLPKINVCMDVDASNVLRVLAGVVVPGNQQAVGPIMEVRMPTIDEGHGWCAEALNRTYGSTLNLMTVQKKS